MEGNWRKRVRRFTEQDKENIRKKRAEGMTVMAIAVEYSASLSTINRFLSEKYAESIRAQQRARYWKIKAENEAVQKELEELREKKREG